MAGRTGGFEPVFCPDCGDRPRQTEGISKKLGGTGRLPFCTFHALARAHATGRLELRDGFSVVYTPPENDNEGELTG